MLRVVKGTVTDGYQPMVMGEAGLLLGYDISPNFSIYEAMCVLERGAKLQTHPTLDHPYDEYWVHVRSQFLEVRFGLQAFAQVKGGLAVTGDVAFAFGPLTGVNTLEIEDGRLVRRSQGKVGCYSGYAGLGLGAGLNYEFHGGTRAFFLPTLQVQLNQALKSNTFTYKYGGLAFRLGVTFPAKKRVKK
ncbi:MAG: hypothetical protein U0176_10905 [Bacteroidia bacterium]